MDEAKMQFTFFDDMTMQRFNELTEHMIDTRNKTLSHS
jgi:hypothetical protein